MYGPRGQGEFLADLGITGRAEQLMQTNPAAAQNLFAAVERLIGPEQMGNLFKAHGLPAAFRRKAARI